MRTVQRAAALGALLCITAAPHAQEWEMTYQGKTTSEWIQALKSNDAGLLVGATWALGEIGPQAVAAVADLIGLFTHENPNVRGNAVEALGKIGPGAKAAVPRLIEILRHTEQTMRWKAALALGGIGPDAASAVPNLMTCLSDDSSDVRMNAALALGKIGPQASSAVPALTQALGDQDWQVRMYAAASLGTVGPEARTAIPALSQALNDQNEAVRTRAAEALRALGETPTQPTAPTPAQPPVLPAETGPPTTSPGMRREALVFLSAGLPTSGKISLASQAIGKYVVPLTFQLFNAENRLVKFGLVQLDSQRDLTLPAEGGDVYMLRLESGLNRYTLSTDTPYCMLASEDYWLRLNRFEGDLHFLVPTGCRQFEVRVLCQSPNEGGAFKIIDPAGQVAAQVAGEVAAWESLAVQPAPEMCGKPWRLNIARDPNTALDDVDMYVSGDVPPLVSVKPEWVASIAPLLTSLPTEGD